MPFNLLHFDVITLHYNTIGLIDHILCFCYYQIIDGHIYENKRTVTKSKNYYLNL